LTTRTAVFGAGQGSLIQSERVLQTGIVTITNAFQWNGGSAGDFDGRHCGSVYLDIDWRGRATFGPDKQLLLLIGDQHLATLPDSFVDDQFICCITGWSRTLFRGP